MFTSSYATNRNSLMLGFHHGRPHSLHLQQPLVGVLPAERTPSLFTSLCRWLQAHFERKVLELYLSGLGVSLNGTVASWTFTFRFGLEVFSV